MFRTMSSPTDRRKLVKEYVAQRELLKSRFLTERLEQQDATAAYKKGIATLLEPTNRTAKQIAKLANTTTKLAQEAQKHTTALENLPGDLAAVLPLDQPPEYHSQLGTTPQVFKEEARQAIATDAIGFANAGPPANWKALVLDKTTSYDASKVKSAWPKWVYREMTGSKQARGKRYEAFLAALEGQAQNPAATSPGRDRRYEAFLAALEEQADWPAATSSGEGLKPTRSGVRYYKDAEELLDRLAKLKSARQAGNTSAELRNEAGDILDKLREDREIDEPLFKGLWEIFE